MLLYVNFCVNLFVYVFMNEGVCKVFKKKFFFVSIFCYCFKKLKMINLEMSIMIDKVVMMIWGGGVESMVIIYCFL